MNQLNLRIFENVKAEPIEVPEREIARCSNHSEILHLCLKFSRVKYSNRKLAELLGMDSGQLNRVLNGSYSSAPRWLSLDKISDLEIICQNSAVSQWLLMRSKGQLNSMSEQRSRASA